MKPILVAMLLFPAISFSAELFRFVPRKACDLEKFLNKAWSKVRSEEVIGRIFELVDSDTPGYLNFKSNQAWYYAKKECFAKVESTPAHLEKLPLQDASELNANKKMETKREKKEEKETQEISDLHYFTEKKGYDLDIGSNLNLGNSGSISIDGASFPVKVKGHEEEAALNYGITDRLQVGIQESYGAFTTTLSTASPIELKEKGFSDPTLLFGYRLINKEETGIYTDLNFTFQPSILKSREAASTEDGTVATGHSRFIFAPALTVQRGMHEFRFTPRIEVATSGQKDDGSIKTNSFTSEEVRLTYRSHVTPKFFLSPSINYHFAHSEPSTEFSSTEIVAVPNRISSFLSPSIDFGYLISKSVLATLGYAYAVNDIDQSEVTTDIATAATTSTSDVKTHLTSHVLKLAFTFEL